MPGRLQLQQDSGLTPPIENSFQLHQEQRPGLLRGRGFLRFRTGLYEAGASQVGEPRSYFPIPGNSSST